ncbi:hypothetical protein LTS17_000801 [Exophiala oligosperma]
MNRKAEIKLSKPYPGAMAELSLDTVIQVDTAIEGSVTDVDIEWMHRDLLTLKKDTTTFKRLRGTIGELGKDEAVVYFPKDKWLDPEYMAKRGYEWAPLKYKFTMTKDWYSVAVVSTVMSDSDDFLGHAARLIAAVEPSAPSNMYCGRIIYDKVEHFEARAGLGKDLRLLMEIPLKDLHFKAP